ncbi:TIGR02391 family protein [Micromonospora sp. NPDC007271]|uniref:TIGR02391 family protein n=1 Tax=Micromonospora sp. NPDC007271 TaxID=3154587 RepID=UPI0033E76239
MAINYAWVLAEWNKFLDMTERVKTGETHPTRSGEIRHVYSFKAPDDEVKKQLATVRLTFQRVFENWEWRGFGSLNHQVNTMRDQIHSYLPMIERSEEIEANLTPDDPGPQIAADDLHPWVWSAAKPHWDSGNDRAAIHAAAVNINSRLRKKLGRFDVSESRAVREAFSIEDPQPGRPRLRLCPPDDPEHFKSVHVGATNLGCGLFGAVRNPVAHLSDEDHDLTEQEALECLAAFSLFARWIDRAEVQEKPASEAAGAPDAQEGVRSQPT